MQRYAKTQLVRQQVLNQRIYLEFTKNLDIAEKTAIINNLFF